MLGYVYVVTTACYEKNSIYKIGFTINLNQRLKSFNATRVEEDKFYCVRNWRTMHYSKLEAHLHSVFKSVRKNNEFFKVELSEIEDAVQDFALTRGPTHFYGDAVLITADLCELEWLVDKELFVFSPKQSSEQSLTDAFADMRVSDRQQPPSSVVCCTEVGMRETVREWLGCVDVHRLVRFLSDDDLDRLVTLLKQRPVAASADVELGSTFLERLWR